MKVQALRSFQFKARQLEVGEVLEMDAITALEKKELGLVEIVKERKTKRKTKEQKNVSNRSTK